MIINIFEVSDDLTLIRVDFFGVRFAVEGGGSKTRQNYDKYTHIFSFRKYNFSSKTPLILLMSAFFCKKTIFGTKTSIFGKNSTFTQTYSMSAMLKFFSSVFSLCKIHKLG